MLKCCKKSLERIMRCMVAYFWAKLGPNCPFALKKDFLRKLANVVFVYLCASDTTTIQEKIFRADHKI